MSIRNILICTTQVPFTKGGAEAHVAGLRDAFNEAGYNAEVVALPFKWYAPAEIMRGALAWRLLDLTEANGRPVDLVVGMKFPAYTVAHPRKVLWVMHQYRAAYNLWGTPFDDLSTHPEGARIRDWIRHCDARFIPEARKVFANSRTVAERLRRYNQIESEPLYHPPPRARARYESLVRQNGVGDRVEMRGFVSEDELVELYSGALGVCYLPFDEDYGYVTLEGMLSSKPLVVARDGGGAAEFVEHGREGFVAEAQPRALAECLDSLYADRGRARRMGERGREKLTGMNLSWRNVVEKIISAAS